MDSYEYYLLYHKDSSSFINSLTENNQEILIALEKLIVKKLIKFESEKTEIFNKVLKLMQESELNDKLDIIFEGLLTPDRREIVKFWVNLQLANFEKCCRQDNVLRIAMILVKNVVVDPLSVKYLLELSNHFVDILLKESQHHAEVLQILKFILDKNQLIRGQILTGILEKCYGRNDKHALQCLCNFFDRICEERLDIDINSLLQKFFTFSAQKQGIFLIKTLVHRKKFNAQDEESFKKFTIVLEALEENQSHLILPSLSLLKSLKFSYDFKNFWFILVQMILSHENSLIRNWGLNYVLANNDYQFNDDEITTILSALNATYLYDPDQNPISLELFNSFIVRNWTTVFVNMINVNWASVPCYKILKIISENPPAEDSSFYIKMLPVFLRQTMTIPKMVKNLVIRLGVQNCFADLACAFMRVLRFPSMVPIILSLMNVSEKSDCLRKCFELLKSEDFEIIFNENYSESFFKLALEAIIEENKETTVEELKHVCGHLKNHETILMEIYCKSFKDGNVEHEIQIAKLIEELCMKNIETASLKVVKSLKLGLKTLRTSNIFKLQEPVMNFWKNLDGSDLFFHFYKVLLEIKIVKFTSVTIPSNLPPELHCQFAVLQLELSPNPEENHKSFFFNFQKIDDMKISCNIMENFLKSKPKSLEEFSHDLTEALDRIFDIIVRSDDKTDFVIDVTNVFLALAESSTIFINKSASYLCEFMEKLTSNDKAKALDAVLNHAEKSTIFDNDSNLRCWLKEVLVDKIVETEILTKEQQIEMLTSCEIETCRSNENSENLTINKKMLLRLTAAKVLASKFKNEFPKIIELYMEDFAKTSKKKPRYFPNSWIHRMKLHCLQPIVLCEGNLTQRTIEILVDEILKINNQLNVSIIIEIILSRHYPSVIEILKDDETVQNLKSPALKSIFSIAVMQMRMEDSFTLLAEKFFGIAEMKLETIHDLIVPFTMGQNYSVRSYAQAAIIILYKHVKSVFGTRESQIMSRIDRSCSVIKESMKFKNASKFIEVLKQDFRFSMKFDEIFTVDSFYYFIPVASKMPTEEVMVVGEHLNKNLRFKIAEMETETESQVMGDEVAVPTVEKSDSTSLSLQQKYLPYKYQVPGEKLMSTIPQIFKGDDGLLSLRLRSNLVVVASLIDRAPNLGGLARTCEIFGAENYVIDSLKLTENSEFKALSKTAEKWLKMFEVKAWQLFDYLLGMKHQGYSIVGAEQSGKSVSLVNVEIPKKCVLLLGNEKEGIPADLLSLLDIIIEIPQQGVIRSLNVHVTGGIVIWEYAKQHLLK